MMVRRQVLWALLLMAGGLSLGLNLWLRQHANAVSAEHWSQLAAGAGPCVALALQDEAFLETCLARPHLKAKDRVAFGEALGRVRDCWRQVAQASDQWGTDPAFQSLERLDFWLAQTVQLGEDSQRLRSGANAAIQLEALHGIQGMRRNQCDAAAALGREALARLTLAPPAQALAQAWVALPAAKP